jgi:hypothetical protein
LRSPAQRRSPSPVDGRGCAAATYKWVDEKGVVHYTDKLPPDAVDKASTELSKQGVPVNKTDKALTPEQRRAKEQEAEKAKENARLQEEIARRDRALVASYTSEAEIDLARNRSLQTSPTSSCPRRLSASS